jgi:hypothetical protein
MVFLAPLFFGVAFSGVPLWSRTTFPAIFPITDQCALGACPSCQKTIRLHVDSRMAQGLVLIKENKVMPFININYLK